MKSAVSDLLEDEGYATDRADTAEVTIYDLGDREAVHHHPPPVVLFSARPDAEEIAQQRGWELVRKPCSFDDLLRIVKKVTGGS